MKNSKRLLAMILVACICAGTVNMPVFAEDQIEDQIEEMAEGEEYPEGVTEETIENTDGTVTELTVTKTTEEDEDGNVTVTLTIDKVTEGTNTDGAEVEGESSETEKTVTDSKGNVVEESSSSESTTVTTETEVNEDGDTTVTETIVETKDEANADGSTLDYDQTTVNTKTENADGSSSEQTVVDGTEVKEWTKEDLGYGEQPEVSAEIIPGETTVGTAQETVVEGDINSEEGQTTTTTTERTLKVEAGDMEVSENEVNDGLVVEQDVKLEGVLPEYDVIDGVKVDKEGLFDQNYLASAIYDYFNINGVSIWVDKGSKTIVDVVVPEGAELPEHKYLGNVTVGASVKDWYNSSNIFKRNEFPADIIFKNQIKINDIDNWYTDEEHEEFAVTVPEDADFMYVGKGEHSKYWIPTAHVVYEKVQLLDENGNPVFDDKGNPVYKQRLDENGNPVFDDEGNPVYEPLLDENGNPVVKMITKTDGKTPLITIDGKNVTEYLEDSELISNYNGSRPTNYQLMDENGNKVVVYCCDNGTNADYGSWYSIKNLEDSDYYVSEESEAHIRSIAMNGYWGTSNIPDEDGEYKTGSIKGIKEKLLAAVDNGELPEEYETYLYSECSCNCWANGKKQFDCTTAGKLQLDEKGNPIKVTYNTRDIIEQLNEGSALIATQVAIWSYSNGNYKAANGEDENIVLGVTTKWSFMPTQTADEAMTNEENAALGLFYNWLMDLDTKEDSSVVINEKNFVEDMSLTVKDKVEEHKYNADENTDNDVYNTELNFRLAFVPDPEKDDLLVYLMDEEGKPIKDKDGKPIIKRLTENGSENDDYEVITPVNGVYTLTGLQLSENDDFEFDLRLEGTQFLEKGVYIYEAVGGRYDSQTFVGIAEGKRNVDVSASMTISFDVDEDNYVVAEREWHYESDPVITPPEEPEVPEEEPEVPEEEPEVPEEEPEVPEEEPEVPEEEPEVPEEEPEVPEEEPEVPEEEPEVPEEEPEVPEEEPEVPEVVEVVEEPEVVDIPDEETPLANIPEEDIPLTDIPDEPVPATGDSFFWYISSAIAALALAAVSFFDKKRKNGENA